MALPPCPCVTLLSTSTISDYVKDRRSSTLEAPTCAVCQKLDAEDRAAAARCSKGRQASISKSCGSSGKKNSKPSSKKQAGITTTTTAATEFIATHICLSCLFVGCEEHAEEHFHHNKNTGRSSQSDNSENKKSNKASSSSSSRHQRRLLRHCVFLEIFNAIADASIYKLKCFNCNMACGNGTLQMTIGGVAEEDIVAAEVVDGCSVNGQGYLMWHDDVAGLTEVCDLAYKAAMGVADKGSLPSSNRKRRGGGGGKEPSRNAQDREQRRAEQELRDRELRQAGIVGLKNLGNTCFFNATLQCLSKCSAFCGLLDSVPDGFIPGPLTMALMVTFRQFQSTSAMTAATIAPRTLFQQICQRNVIFSDHGQQDAQELLGCVLNGIAAEFKFRRSVEMCPVTAAFQGTLRTKLTCHGCHRTTSSLETFSDLSVPMRSNLDDALAAFFEPQLMSGDNAYACESCHRVAFLEREAQLKSQLRAEEERTRRLCAESVVVSGGAVGASSLMAAMQSEVEVAPRVVDSDDSDSDEEGASSSSSVMEHHEDDRIEGVRRQGGATTSIAAVPSSGRPTTVQEDDEDDDLRRAIEASLQTTQPTPPPPPAQPTAAATHTSKRKGGNRRDNAAGGSTGNAVSVGTTRPDPSCHVDPFQHDLAAAAVPPPPLSTTTTQSRAVEADNVVGCQHGGPMVDDELAAALRLSKEEEEATTAAASATTTTMTAARLCGGEEVVPTAAAATVIGSTPQSQEAAVVPAVAPPPPLQQPPPVVLSSGSLLRDATMAVELADLSTATTVVIHLKRFRFDINTLSWHKDSRRIHFERTLRLDRFVGEPPPSPPRAESAAAATTEPSAATATTPAAVATLPPAHRIQYDTLQSMFPTLSSSVILRELQRSHYNVLVAGSQLTDLLGDSQGGSSTAAAVTPAAAAALHEYSLVGFVEHRGTCEGGHYVAYVVSPATKKWYVCSDSEVTNVSDSTAMNSEPYLLFYQR